MSALPKIIIGALATTASAWFLNGPLGLGQRCEAAGRVGAGVPAGSLANGSAYGLNADDSDIDLGTGSNLTEDATPETVRDCQSAVTQAVGASTVNFSTGGAGVAPDSSALLDQIAASLQDCTGVKVEVAGHTDAQGDASTNQQLSQRRAEAVVAELTRRGIPADRLTARGYGETRLIDPNGPENNPRNRRIEFTVSAPGAQTAA